jgi:hypothetical protein
MSQSGKLWTTPIHVVAYCVATKADASGTLCSQIVYGANAVHGEWLAT